MGLTNESVGWNMLLRKNIDSAQEGIIVALAGNPNTGKSTIFNELTGMHQHTGNWPGKTVLQVSGDYWYNEKRYVLIDLPGTYSLMANSKEEEVARDFIYFGKPQVTVVVTDATCLERNLNLVYQIMEISPNIICCVNLMDEAKRKHVDIDCTRLEELLGIPVVPMVARAKKGFDQLKEIIAKLSAGMIRTTPNLVEYERELEEKIALIQQRIEPFIQDQYSTRWLALRILDGDEVIINHLKALQGSED